MTIIWTIKGVVDNIKLHQGYEEFIFNRGEDTIAGIVAIGTAAVEQFPDSTFRANGNTRTDVSMEFFTCFVNGKNLCGRFYKVEFKEGEVVEFAVEDIQGHIMVRAARSESQRIIWMCPHEVKGYKAQKRSDIKWTLILSSLITSAAGIYEISITQTPLNLPIRYTIILLVGLFLTSVIINAAIRWHLYPFSVAATDVFMAMNFTNPPEVDLNKIHKEAARKIKCDSKTLPPLVTPWSFRF